MCIINIFKLHEYDDNDSIFCGSYLVVFYSNLNKVKYVTEE